MPAPASTHVKCTVTGALFQPFAFGGGLSVAEIVGGPRSIRIGLLVTFTLLPASSVPVPVTVLTASAVAVWSGGHAATPDSGSTQVKCAVTGVFDQPVAVEGAKGTRITGAARSMLIGSLCTVVVFPAASLTVAVAR